MIKKVAPKQTESQGPQTLEHLFSQFSQGAKEIDGKVFAKLCKDCKVISKDCSATDVDLVFAQVKDKSSRKITFEQFKRAIEICAQKLKVTRAQLVDKMLLSDGPVFTGTKADAVKYHDDKSLYTGVYANGGPSTIGGTGGISDISQLCDRTSANVRGSKI